MQPISIHRGATLAPILLTSLLAVTTHAQERTFAPIAPTPDVKTAREPSRAGSPPPARPAFPAGVAAMPPKADAPSAVGTDPNSPAAPATRQAIDHSRMYYDAPGDGSLWARGKHYKAGFDGAGATYYPLFGGDQPRHFPLTLSPDVVTLDGAALAFDRDATAVRSENRVDIDRGAFIERYEMTPDSIEQLFVFDALPPSSNGGELIVHVPITSELDAAHGAGGFEFRSEFGHVSYGRAVAIDARGLRSDASTELENGSIAIRVDASFLRAAQLPLVIDPVVSTFPIDSTSYEDFFPDVSYDASTQRWLCVFEEQAAAGDNDVYYDICNSAGSPMWGGYVNLNNASWNDVKCANMRWASQFLAVCSVEGSGTREIRGRTIEADVAAMGNEFFISGGESGPKFNPSVGGDPSFIGPSLYCVAYEREYDDFEDYDILVRMVGYDSSVSAPIYLSNSGDTIDQFPSVSKSNNETAWMIAWERHEIDLGESHIWGGRVNFDGTVLNTPFQITAFADDIYCSASSPLVGSQRTMVAYQRNYGTDWDIVASVLDGANVITEVNLSTMESTWFLQDQAQPSVDSDGRHFLVSYLEQYSNSTTDYDIYVSDFHLTGNTLALSQPHMNLAYTSDFEGTVRMASAASSGGPAKRFMATWYRYLTSTNSDVNGALIDALEGGTKQPFCFGDGSSGACPCNNQGAAGRGCAHSGNASGAQLQVLGTVSTANDTAVLSISGAPAAALCIFVQSNDTPAATPFGDGLGCIGAGMVRLMTKSASGGVANYPLPSDISLHVRGGVPLNGGRRAYQVWYRNSASFCTSAAFNISNGVIVNWAR